MSKNPVVLFQWRSAGDADEPEQIRTALSNAAANATAHAYTIPDLASRTTTEPTGAGVLDEFERFLKVNEQLQVMYFSAHGAPGENFYNQNGESIGFAQFGHVLGSCLKDGAVAVVLGACHAAACGIEQHLPDCVHWVYGYTATPTTQDVINLMAGVVEDMARLTSEVSKANAAYASAVSAKSDAKASDYFGPVLASHVPRIMGWLKSKGNLSGHAWVRERNDSGGWSAPQTIG